MRGKHERITINTLSDDVLATISPLDTKWSSKAWVSNTEEMNLSLLPYMNKCTYIAMYFKNFTLKKQSLNSASPTLANLVSCSHATLVKLLY